MNDYLKEMDEILEILGTVVALPALDSNNLSEKPLYELGIDSLATVNVFVEMATRAEVELDDFIDDIELPKTLADLCRINAHIKEELQCN